MISAAVLLLPLLLPAGNRQSLQYHETCMSDPCLFVQMGTQAAATTNGCTVMMALLRRELHRATTLQRWKIEHHIQDTLEST
jgi:hypothetical protein